MKGTGELEGGLKLTGEGFETVDDVLQDLGSGLQSMVIVVLELPQRRFRGSWLTKFAVGPTAVLVLLCDLGNEWKLLTVISLNFNSDSSDSTPSP